MTEATASLQTIFFADISNSTRLYEQLGDTRALELVSTCMDKIEQVTGAQHGYVIKTIGDEIMCCFANPDAAAAAAVRTQEMITNDPEMFQHQIRIRIGFHHGPAIMEEGDFFGDAVNLAARMVGQAKAGQIITTRGTLELMSPEHRRTARMVDQARIKGKQDLLEIYEIAWGQPEELTMISTYISDFIGSEICSQTRMTLRFQESTICIDLQTPVITIGRDASNHLVVNDPRVSRLHARIELRRDKFVLVDQSTNGTYILPGNGEIVLMRRDEIVLPGKGTMTLGHQAVPDSPMAINFEILQNSNNH